jgi:hypothetical protein
VLPLRTTYRSEKRIVWPQLGHERRSPTDGRLLRRRSTCQSIATRPHRGRAVVDGGCDCIPARLAKQARSRLRNERRVSGQFPDLVRSLAWRDRAARGSAELSCAPTTTRCVRPPWMYRRRSRRRPPARWHASVRSPGRELFRMWVAGRARTVQDIRWFAPHVAPRLVALVVLTSTYPPPVLLSRSARISLVGPRVIYLPNEL